MYSALESQPRAARWLRQALKFDVQCIEALDMLVNHRMLTTTEEHALLAELTFAPHQEWLRLVYRAKLDQHDPCSDITVLATATALESFGIKYFAIPLLCAVNSFIHLVGYIGITHVSQHVQHNSYTISIISVNVTPQRNILLISIRINTRPYPCTYAPWWNST